jgi:excisionase family DNA binding protein
MVTQRPPHPQRQPMFEASVGHRLVAETRPPAALETDGNALELLTVRQAAHLLGLTEKAVRARVDRRTIPFRLWGGRIVFVRSELAEFVRTLAGCTVGEATTNAERRR